jgi:hypothetical protein
VACIKVKKTLYVYDSFGRQTKYILKKLLKLNKGTRIIESRRDPEQQGNQQDCGLRCITWLLIAKKHGIKKALTI